jgi:hypothetical protein
LQNAFAISQHVRIPEPQNAIALRHQPLVALSVALRLGVLTSIDFDHKHAFMAYEVEDERSDGGLTPEAQAVQSMRSQPGPQSKFSVGHLMAQSLCMATMNFRYSAMR